MASSKIMVKNKMVRLIKKKVAMGKEKMSQKSTKKLRKMMMNTEPQMMIVRLWTFRMKISIKMTRSMKSY